MVASNPEGDVPYEFKDTERAATEAERRDRDRRTLPAHATVTQRQRRAALWGVGALAVVALVGLILVLTFSPGTVAEPRVLDGMVADGDQLILRWSVQECEAVNRSDVSESSEEIVVTLYVDVPSTGCSSLDEVRGSTRIDLDSPAGDRKLVDGACLFATSDRRC